MFKLYAQAAIYSPPPFKYAEYDFVVPELPSSVREKTVKINSKHCDQYHRLTNWQNSIAAVVHPNYIQTLSLSMQLDMMVSNPFPFKPMGLVHVANQIDVQFLPEQDTSLELRTSFGKVFYHRRGWLFEVLTSAEVDNEQAILGTSYYLARRRHSPEANKHFQSEAKKAGHGLPSWIDEIVQDTLNGEDEVTSCMSAVSESLMFSDDIGRRYAKVSGDYNPIHLYPYTAKLLGFKKAIAHGMYSKALSVSKVAQHTQFYKRSCCVKCVFMLPITLPLNTELLIQGPQVKFGADIALDEHIAFTLLSKLSSQASSKLSANKRNKSRIHLVGTIEALT